MSTTDFFFPLLEDPYLMGRVAAANVLSDAYALGVRHIDTMLMLLCAATDIHNAELRAAVAQLMMAGFVDGCALAGTEVTGGQTTLNPWPLIGGVAEAVVRSAPAARELLMPERARPGDVLVLTKPLGTQLAVNLYQWLGQMEDAVYLTLVEANRDADAAAVATAETENAESVRKRGDKARMLWRMLDSVLSPAQAVRAYDVAAASMMRLNANAAQLMHEYGAHAATDITGFGLLGHARNLARNQRAHGVDLVIERMPVLAGMLAADAALDAGNMFGLAAGRSSETSGGLLVCLPDAASAQRYCRELRRRDGGWSAWTVGRVAPGKGEAYIVEGVEVIEV